MKGRGDGGRERVRDVHINFLVENAEDYVIPKIFSLERNFKQGYRCDK